MNNIITLPHTFYVKNISLVNVDILNIPLFYIPFIFLVSVFFFNTMKLQKIKASELPLPLRSPGNVQGKEEGVFPVPLTRMDAVSKSGQKK